MVGSLTRRRLRPRTVLWAAAVILAVVVVPMSAYFLGESPLDLAGPPVAQDAIAEQPFDLGHPYDVTGSVTVPVGDGGVPVLADVPGAAGPLALSTVLPADNGGAWFVTLPAKTQPDSLVRLYDGAGRLVSAFEVPEGLALAAPGREGDIWLGFAALGDSGSEVFRRYSSYGELLGEYTVPPGVFARSLSVTPENELWVQLEEYGNLAEELASLYRSSLLPVAIGDGLLQASDQLEAALDGSFFGEDGLRYVVDGELVPFAGDFAFPPSLVRVYDGETQVRTFETHSGWRPFGADLSGRVWCEPLPLAPPADTVGYELIGDGTARTLELRGYAQDGLWSRIPVQLPRFLNDFSPLARVNGDELTVVQAGDDGVSAVRLAPSSADGLAREPLPPTAPELRIVAGPGTPISGDPYLARDDGERDVWRLVHAGLVKPISGDGVEPDIALEVPSIPNGGVSNDGLTLTYRIDTSRVWHDDTPLSASDVVATWEHLTSPGAILRNTFPGSEYVLDVRAEGQDVVVVELSEPYGPAPLVFFPYVLPASALESPGSAVNGPAWSLPVGAGPYRMLAWGETGRMTLEAADGAGIAHVEVVFAEQEAALAAFQGSASPTIWLRVPDRLTLDIERDGVGSLLSAPTGYWRGLVFNTQDSILRDPAVRKAIDLSLPRDEWAALFPRGAESPVPVFDSAENVPGAGDQSPDLEAARRVLDSAGWLDTDGDGVREKGSVTLDVGFALAIRDGRDEVSFEELEPLEKVWTEIGIKPSRQFGAPFAYASWYSNGYLATGRHQVFVGVFQAPFDPAVGSLFDPSDVPSATNQLGIALTHTDDRQLGELHRRARAEQSAQMRGDLGGQVIDRASELNLLAPMRPDVRTLAVIGTIENLEPAAYPAGTLWNVHDWSFAEESR